MCDSQANKYSETVELIPKSLCWVFKLCDHFSKYIGTFKLTYSLLMFVCKESLHLSLSDLPHYISVSMHIDALILLSFSKIIWIISDADLIGR